MILIFGLLKIFSCWLRKEDMRYSVSKLGNEITSTQNHEISKKNKSNVLHLKIRKVVVLRGISQLSLTR